METLEVQQQFFNYLKDRLPPHVSLADELAELLEIGYDSVYRRIRGEKHLSLSELKVICGHYKLSLDHALQIQTDAIIFNARALVQETKDMEEYLKEVFTQMKFFLSFKDRKMYYICKDFALFQFFYNPQLAAFKCFYWMRDTLGDDRLKDLKFSYQKFPFPNILSLGHEIAKAYMKIDSVEIFNPETISSTIGQLEFYKETEIFASEEEMLNTCNGLEQTINHLQAMAERGVKFYPGESELVKNGSFELYANDVLLGNNTILVILDGKATTFIPHAALTYMATRDPRFGNFTLNYFNTLMNRSALISKVGEKERRRFFNNMRKRIQRVRDNHVH